MNLPNPPQFIPFFNERGSLFLDNNKNLKCVNSKW